MSVVGRGVHRRGGKLVGIVPKMLAEYCESLGEYIQTPDVHSRVKAMYEMVCKISKSSLFQRQRSILG